MSNKLCVIITIAISFLVIPPLFAVDTQELIKKGREASVFITAEFQAKGMNRPISKTGTGFVVDTTKSPGLIIVTNRHILEHKIRGRIIQPSKITVKIDMSDLEPTLYNADIIALHDTYDIGLLYPHDLVKIPKDAKLKKASGRQYYGWKTKNFLLEDSLIDDSDIKEGLQVFFSGYPLNLGTEKFKNYPITRRGIVAQVIPGEKRFIMDGFASRGNSGSPVYCLIGDSIKLVGIQRSVYNDANVGYDEKGNINSLVSFNSGLSVVIKASVIRDFLYELIENGRYKGDWSD